MDFDFSRDSVAFSDIAPPSHVSELESFSDFEFSDASSVEFAAIGIRDNDDSPEGKTGAEDKGRRGNSTEEFDEKERIPSALQELNAGSVMECLAARKDLILQGKLSDSGHDQSSLGILHLDSLLDTSDMLNLTPAQAEKRPVMNRTPISDEKPPAQNSHVSNDASNMFGDVPFHNDSPSGKSMASTSKEKRPDTGQVPDDFFNFPAADIESGDAVDQTNGEDSLGFSLGEGYDMNFRLPGRSGSGDGGEFIDRMSLSSSMSFIQSQTLPTESIFSLSSASRGLGSGMDSRPGSANGGDTTAADDDQANTLSPDSHNEERNGGLARRPGLEGANSDTEDAAFPQTMHLSRDQRNVEATVRELRQSAEGEVVVPGVPGDGGGGGDGSSGHSSDDDRGPAGAAYVSSSSSTAPSISVPLHPNTIDALLRVGLTVGVQEPQPGSAHDVSGLSANRGHPVGGAVAGGWTGAVDTSPLLGDTLADQSRASFMNTGQFEFQVASTPMVNFTPGRDADEDVSLASDSSGLRSCYLLAAGSRHDTVAVTPYGLAQESTFHMSDMFPGNEGDDDGDQTLTELPSLNLDVETSASASTLVKQQTVVVDKRDTSAGYDRLEVHRRVTDHSSALQPDTSDVSLRLSKSALPSDMSGVEGDSQLWKSTPREDEEAVRATPGIIFKGDLRPSPVSGHQDSDQASHSTVPESTNNSVIEVSREEPAALPADLSCLPADLARTVNDALGRAAKVQEYLSKLDELDNVPFERTLTPGGPSEEPGARWPSYPFTPSPIVPQEGQEHRKGKNPFDSEDEGFDWSGAAGEDFGFVSQQGDAAEILDADEKRFKQDQLEKPPVGSSFFQDHDWTLPDESKIYVRASLMEMFGMEEPENTGEGRVSLGKFLAAGSEELGSLSNTDQGRPRPHFGGNREIITPPPRPPPRVISDFEAENKEEGRISLEEVLTACSEDLRSLSNKDLGRDRLHLDGVNSDSFGSPCEEDRDAIPQKTRPNESLKFSDLLPEKDLHGKSGEISSASGTKENDLDNSSRRRLDIERSTDGVQISTQASLLQDKGKSNGDKHLNKDEVPRHRKGSRDSSYSSSSSKSSKSSQRSVKGVVNKRRDGVDQTDNVASVSGNVERQDRGANSAPRKRGAGRKQPRPTDKPKRVETEARESENTISSRGYESPESLSNLERATERPRSQVNRIDTPSTTPFTSSTITSAASSSDVKIPSALNSSDVYSQDIVGFISKAIKVDPNDLRWLMDAAKSRVSEKSSGGSSFVPTTAVSRSGNPGEREANPSKVAENAHRLEGNPNGDASMFLAQPIGSSSPATSGSPERVLVSSRGMTDELADLEFSPAGATASDEASFFSQSPLFQDNPGKQRCSDENGRPAITEVKIAEQYDPSGKHTAPLTPPRAPFSSAHIIPEFGETYTVKSIRRPVYVKASTVDPLKRRTSEIEDRLDMSLSASESLPMSPSRGASRKESSRTDILTPFASERQPVPPDSFDSAIGNMSSHRTFEDSKSKHSATLSDTGNGELSKPKSDTRHISDGQSSVARIEPGSQGRAPLDKTLGPQFMDHCRPVEISHAAMITPAGIPLQIPSSIQFVPHGTTVQGLQTGFGHAMGTLGMGSPLYSLNAPHSFGTPLGYTLPAIQGQPINGWGPRVAPVGGSITHFPSYGLIPGHGTHAQPSVNTVSATRGPIPSTLTTAFDQMPMQVNAGTTSQTRPYVSLSQVTMGAVRGLGASLPQTPVIVPGEVKFPPVCCVGVITQTVLPLHNSSSRWMQCGVGVVACEMNGEQVPVSGECPFSVQSKVIIAPHTTDNIKVKFEPKRAGAFKVKLQVVSSVVVKEFQSGAQDLESVPCTVSLDVLTEEPKVEILAEDSKVIDFGEMVGGSKQSRPLRLINKGRAAVPVRIILSAATSSLHCFSFAKADSSTVDEKAPFSLRGPGMPLSIQTLTVPGRSDMNAKVEPIVVWLLFQAPQTDPDDSGPLRPPGEYSSRVDVEIDSAGQGPTIASILTKAFVGVVRLHIPRSNLKALKLVGMPGERVNLSLPLRNAGNIPFQVELKVLKHHEFFTISPSRLRLTPGQENDVIVHFKSAEPNAVIASLLTMTVLPNGPEYELVLQGSTTAMKDDSAFLLCNKSVVCWGGVRMGRSAQQKLILKNKSSSPTKKLKLRLSIQGNHSDFQVQNVFDTMDKESQSSLMTLGPQEELPVHLLFAPSSVGLISSALIMTSANGGGIKSKVPLYGHGGTSEVVVLDTQQVNKGYTTSIGEVSLGRKNTIQLTVRNSGTRAAFVKLICYSDLESLAVYPTTHTTVTPNSFILPERTSKNVSVSYQPLERDAKKCRREKSNVASLAIYSGDETIRRQYKAYLKKSGRSFSETWAEGFHLLTGFEGKDKAIEAVDYPRVPRWDHFFQRQVNRVVVFLMGSPPIIYKPNRSLDVVPVPDTNGTQASSSAQGPQTASAPAQTSAPTRTRKGALRDHANTSNEADPDTWDIIPKHLVLSMPETKNGAQRLQLINFSERDLGFEFILPAHCLVVTPDRGKLPSRSQVVVIMSTRSDLDGLALPWGGTVYVQCDRTTKSIRVQIREDLVLDHSPYHPGSTALQSLAKNTDPATPHRPLNPKADTIPLRVSPKNVEFPDTGVGKISVACVTVQNNASYPQQWILSSVAPAYVKAPVDTGSIFRTTYKAFSFHSQCGVINAGATLKLAVKFQPLNIGKYSQFWDMQTKPDNAKRDVKVRIALTGQAIKALPSAERNKQKLVKLFHEAASNDKSQQASIDDNPVTHPSGGAKFKHSTRGLYVESGTLEFPDTFVGEMGEMKVKLCNESENSFRVRVAKPEHPFSVVHREFVINPRHFMRIPVQFKPPRPKESYTSLVTFAAMEDISIPVLLKGRSAPK